MLRESMRRRLFGVDSLCVAAWLIACGAPSPTERAERGEPVDPPPSSAPSGGSDAGVDADQGANTPISEGDAGVPPAPPGASPGTGASNEAPGATAPSLAVSEIPPLHEAGTRLQPIVLRSGAVDQFTGTFWDEAAQAACRVSDAGRCEFGYPSSVVFLDDRCSTPLLRIQYADCYDRLPEWKRPRAAIRSRDTDSCEEPELYRAVGERVPPPATVYEGGLDVCTPRTPNPYDGFYDVELVSAGVATTSLSVEPRDAPLHAHVQTGSDGSWAVEGFYDPNREWACTPLSSSYAAVHACVPTMSQSGWFLDDGCETPFAIGTGAPCSMDPVVFPVLSPLDGTCSPRSLELFALGERVEGVPHLGGTACTPLGDESISGFLVGDAIDVSALPTAEPMLGGEGRLRAPLVGSGGVPYVRDWSRPAFFDTELAQGCREMIFADGAIYCVPESFDEQTDTQLFVDATCTGDRLFSRSSGTCQSDFEGVVLNQIGCGSVQSEVFSVVPFEGETGYQLSSDGTCTQFSITVKTPHYRSTGRIEPSQRFAPLEAVVVE